MKIINCTPHAINFLREDNSVLVTIEPSGTIARASQTRERVSEVNEIPVNQCSYGAVTGLPDPQDGTIYLVSALTAQAMPQPFRRFHCGRRSPQRIRSDYRLSSNRSHLMISNKNERGDAYDCGAREKACAQQ